MKIVKAWRMTCIFLHWTCGIEDGYYIAEYYDTKEEAEKAAQRVSHNRGERIEIENTAEWLAKLPAFLRNEYKVL